MPDSTQLDFRPHACRNHGMYIHERKTLFFGGGSLRTKHPALLNQNRKLQEQCPVAGYDKCSPDEFPVCELHRTPSCEQTWNQSEQLVHWKLVCCVAPPIGNLPASEDWMDANVTLGVPETRYASCIISVCTVLVKIRDPNPVGVGVNFNALTHAPSPSNLAESPHFKNSGCLRFMSNSRWVGASKSRPSK